MQKFYLHDAATTVTGTLPGASTQSTTLATPDGTATGASTNRSMDDTIGTSQVSQTWTSIARSTAQSWWLRRFISPPLAATTTAATKWGLWGAVQQSNTNMGVSNAYSVIYFWRPSAGSLVGYVRDNPTSSITGATVLTEVSNGGDGTFATNNSVTILNGDVLVLELWASHTQAMSTAYTGTTFYDGTVDVPTGASGQAVASAGAYILAPADLALATTGTTIPDVYTARSRT